MSPDFTISQGGVTSESAPNVPTQSSQQTLNPIKGFPPGESISSGNERSQCFKIDNMTGHFTCKYIGNDSWKTEKSQTVRIHRWLCKFSNKPSQLHIGTDRTVTGTSLPNLLPPGSVCQQTTAKSNKDSFGYIRMGFSCFDVKSDATPPPAVLIEALAKTSEQGPFPKLDFTYWAVGHYLPDRDADGFAWDFDECQDRLMVLATVEEIDGSEFVDYRKRQPLLWRPVYEDMDVQTTSGCGGNLA